MDESAKGLGKLVQRLRRKAGLTQEQLAEKAELSLKYLGELERGRGNPTLSILENIASALKMSLSEMFAYDDERRSAEEVRAEIERLLRGASHEECKTALRVLRALLK